MRASRSSLGRRLAFVSAFAGTVAVVGCQVILGIDPDSRSAAVAGGEDATLQDVAISDATRLETGAGEGSIVLDAGPSCHTSAECASRVHTACEQAICGDAGTCELSSRDGQGCGGDGTCRGYACIGSASTIAASNDSTCVTTVDGFVWCWGADPSGILGDQGSAPRSTPYLVSHLGQEMPGAREVSLGNAHACAILNDSTSTIACWGSDEYGQSTAIDAGASIVGPSQIYGLPPVAEVAAGFGQTCIVGGDSTVWCWGDNEEGELGGGPGLPSMVRAPTQALVGPASDLSGAWKTICVSSPGAISCWGDATWGQIGEAVADASTSTPTPIAALAGGLEHSVQPAFARTSRASVCVLLRPGGYVQCLGNDRDGQLGIGEKVDDAGEGGLGDLPHARPETVTLYDPLLQTVEPLQNAEDVIGSTGAHFCARVRNSSQLDCWGHQESFELGEADNGDYVNAQAAPQTAGASSYALGNEHACELFHDVDGWAVMCFGDGGKGQLGDGLALTAHSNRHPRQVRFPTTPGGLDALRASQ